jgi:CO dehydrogenase/acetyl-CoA synthase delta subunit
VEVDGRSVASIRESWLVEDGWWTARPLRRRYWEVVTECGRNIVVFRDLTVAPSGVREEAQLSERAAAHGAARRTARARGGWFVQGS